MDLCQAELIVESKKNDNIYYMFKDKIIIKTGDEKFQSFYLPKEDKIMCFYDMYYAGDGLRIVIATRGNYDLVYILNEYNLNVEEIKLTK